MIFIRQGRPSKPSILLKENRMSFFLKRLCLFLSLVFLLSLSFSAPARSAEAPIAKLTRFSGTVLIKSLGKWGVEPADNLPLYSQDKVVTRIGVATVTFNDGAVLEIKSNSNVLIEEREKEEGILGTMKVIERRIFLFLGKMFFKTGKADIETRFEAATAVIGIRGTSGTLSIAEDGTCWITFTEGGAAFTINAFIGEAPPVPQDVADNHPVQLASFVADEAAEKCRRAIEQAELGEISEAQKDWICGKAMEASLLERMAYLTELIENSPDPQTVLEAQRLFDEAQLNLNSVLEGLQQSIREGAVPEYEGFERPEILGVAPLGLGLGTPEGVINVNPLELTPRRGFLTVGETELGASPSSP
jgi:hypothetical protein